MYKFISVHKVSTINARRNGFYIVILLLIISTDNKTLKKLYCISTLGYVVSDILDEFISTYSDVYIIAVIQLLRKIYNHFLFHIFSLATLWLVCTQQEQEGCK